MGIRIIMHKSQYLWYCSKIMLLLFTFSRVCSIEVDYIASQLWYNAQRQHCSYSYSIECVAFELIEQLLVAYTKSSSMLEGYNNLQAQSTESAKFTQGTENCLGYSYVYVRGYKCMSGAICVCPGLYVYVRGYMCMSGAICVCQGLASRGIFSEDFASAN